MTLKTPDNIASFDTPEVGALIDDLDLVLVNGPYLGKPLQYLPDMLFADTDGVIFFIPCHMARLRFCERYKLFLDEKKRLQDALCREVYKRNKKFSRYVHASY